MPMMLVSLKYLAIVCSIMDTIAGTQCSLMPPAAVHYELGWASPDAPPITVSDIIEDPLDSLNPDSAEFLHLNTGTLCFE